MAATKSTATHASTSQSAPAASGGSDDKTMGLVAHLLLIFTWWLGPLIIWIIKKEQRGMVEEHAREALNFGITLTIAYIAVSILSFFLAFITFGLSFLLPLIVWAVGVIFGIMGCMAANKGQSYRYPVSLRLVKAPA